MDPLFKEITKIVAVIGWSAFKYFVGLIHTTVIFNQGFIPSVLLTIGGGMLGVLVFGFFDKRIRNLWHRLRGDNKKSKPVKFSKNKRRMVKFRNKFGLAGIAFLTPIFLSVPIGTFMALRLTHNMYRISLFMFISFLFFSLFFCGLYYGFHSFFLRIFGGFISE